MSRPGHSTIDRAYLCPEPFYRSAQGEWRACDPAELFAWTQSMLQDSASFLRLQPAYKYIDSGLAIINGDEEITGVQSISNVKTESTTRNCREIVAAQTNLRIIPQFKAGSAEYDDQSNHLNKSFTGWQQLTFAHRRLRAAWQYAVAGGTGYVGNRYDPNFYYRGSGDIVWDVYGPLDVLPLALPPDMNLQRAYAVALRKLVPIHEVWRMFPLQRGEISSNRVTATGKGMVMSQAVKFASAVLRRFGQGQRPQENAATWDNCNVYYIYVDDDSVNETGHELQIMGPDGQWGTSWSYTVPFVGQQIPSGVENGQPKFHTASRKDCLIYPNRRLVISTDTCVVNPNPEHQSSYRWDAKIPIVQFRADDWAWNFLGFPATRYGQNLEKLIIELWRGLGDQMNLRLNPPSFFDRGSTASALLATANTRIPGLRMPLDMQLNGMDSQFKPMLPSTYYDTNPIILEAAAKILPGILKEQMGVADVTALARARQLPSGDSTQKLLEAMGPLVQDESRSMELSVLELGDMWKSDWFQFATAKRRMQMFGASGETKEDYDFDPGTLVPNSDPPESALFPRMAIPQFERARWHKGQFSFGMAPYSMHEFNSTTRKLFIMQLMKAGFPLSWWDQATLFDMPNFGPNPMFKDPETGEMREAKNMIERWICQLEIMARMQQANAGGQGQKKQRGRPASGQQAPTLEAKSGGRSTVRESAH